MRRLAASLLAQEYPGPPPEIIFVDNGSTDGGLDALADLPVTVIRAERRGAPVARNAGARRASGEVIVFTDHDCTAERRWLARLVEPFGDPAVPAVAGETIASPGETWAARYAAFIRHNSAAVSLRRDVFPFAPTANLAVRRPVFEELGGFDEMLHHTDDADFSLRVKRATGQPIALAPRAIVFHAERPTARALFRRYREYGKGWADLLRKHPDELRWTMGLECRADFDVAAALGRVPAGLARWRLGGGEAMDFHYRWFEFLRRFAHRLGFVEQSITRSPPVRLLAMAGWLPRIVSFVSGVERRFGETSLPDWLQAITPAAAGASGVAGAGRGRPVLTAAEMSRVIWNVLRWNRGRFNNGCFVRSFTRYRFFREIGYPVVFHLGVEDRNDSTLSGPTQPLCGSSPTPAPPPSFEHLRSHAWLTLDGVPFMEFEPERFRAYRVLFSYPE